jgi:hypothetical protein
MKSFFQELRIVPRIVWPIALLATGGMCYFFVKTPRIWPVSRTELAFLTWGALIFFAWIVMIGYIYADCRRRGMRYIMWTLLAVFIPYFIGAILYFVLRDPLLIPCPKCASHCRSTFVYCPKCGAELSPACPVCKRAVEPTWNRCAFCGKELILEISDSTR